MKPNPHSFDEVRERREQLGTQSCLLSLASLRNRGKKRYAVIDEKDNELVLQHRWNYDGRYAYTKLPDGTKLYLHRFITSVSKGLFVDHANGNKLDNRNCNLRICTKNGNEQNKGLTSKNTTGVKGVWSSSWGWHAEITANGTKLRLGTFKTKLSAALAYNQAASRMHGEYARLNQI